MGVHATRSASALTRTNKSKAVVFCVFRSAPRTGKARLQIVGRMATPRPCSWRRCRGCVWCVRHLPVPARHLSVPSQCAHPCHPRPLYVLCGVDGMSLGRSPLLLHSSHSLCLSSPRERAAARACSNVAKDTFWRSRLSCWTYVGGWRRWCGHSLLAAADRHARGGNGTTCVRGHRSRTLQLQPAVARGRGQCGGGMLVLARARSLHSVYRNMDAARWTRVHHPFCKGMTPGLSQLIEAKRGPALVL